jgi:TolA-binding protein
VGRRLTRRQIKRDEFVSLVDRGMHWMGGNWRQAALGLGAALVIGLLWWGTSMLLGTRTAAAAGVLGEALAVYDAPVGAAAPATAKVKFATDTERLDAAEKGFKKVTSRYWLTPQARAARLYLGRIAMERGDTDGAIRILSEVARRKSDETVVRLAMLGLVQLRLGRGEGIQLAPELEAMAVGKDPRLPRDVALLQLGRVWEREGKAEEAIKYYRKLVEDFPDSPYRVEAQQRVSALS